MAEEARYYDLYPTKAYSSVSTRLLEAEMKDISLKVGRLWPYIDQADPETSGWRVAKRAGLQETRMGHERRRKRTTPHLLRHR